MSENRYALLCELLENATSLISPVLVGSFLVCKRPEFNYAHRTLFFGHFGLAGGDFDSQSLDLYATKRHRKYTAQCNSLNADRTLKNYLKMYFKISFKNLPCTASHI